MYNIFTNDNGKTYTEDIQPLLNGHDIERRIKYLYKTRLNGVVSYM